MNNTKRCAMGLAIAFAALLMGCGRSDAGSDDGRAIPSPQAVEAAGSTLTVPPPVDVGPEPSDGDEGVPRVMPAGERLDVDYLTFAQGAIPISVGGAGADLGATVEDALRIIDGDPGYFPFLARADSTTDTEFVYELPALTTFTRFGVPSVNETPSPSQTFTKHVEVYGSTTGPDGGWELLAAATLETHEARGLITEIPATVTMPVRWVRLRLVGGIHIETEQSFFEFSEIIGHGTQEAPALVDHFQGIWKGRGVLIELKQEGATVTGCYDARAELTGTVTGNILRARGIAPDDSVMSLFILSVVEDGLLRGVRSTNGAPFRLYTGPLAPAGTTTDCTEIPEPELGCGSVIHGINFDFDSATIRPDSEPVLAELFEGLQADPSAAIVIEGYTSSEGSEAYNQDLSERRAQSVVEDLVRRGLDAGRITARGMGEGEPIASNDDESGRSLNRRVEVVCR